MRIPRMRGGDPGFSRLMEAFPIGSSLIVGVIGGIVTLAAASKLAAYLFSFLKSGLLLAQGILLRFAGARTAATVAQAAGTAADNAGAAASLRLGMANRAGAAWTWLKAGASRAATLAQAAYTAVTGTATVAMLRQAIAARVQATGIMFMAGATRALALGAKIMNLVFSASPIGLVLTGIVILGSVLLTVFDGLRAKFLGFVSTALDALGPLGTGIRRVASFLGIGGDDKTAPLALSTAEGMSSGAADFGAAEILGAGVPDIGSVPAYAGSGLGGGASITVDMPINVDMGADGKVFAARLAESKPEIEEFMRGLLRRILDETERQKARVEYAW